MGNYHYFDVARYQCNGCKSSFQATDPESMKKDTTGLLRGVFRFFMTSRTVMDEQLYLWIVKNMGGSLSTHPQTIQHYNGKSDL